MTIETLADGDKAIVARETGGKDETSETRGVDLRSSRFPELRTSNFGSRLSRTQVRSSTADPRFTFHAARFTALAQHPAKVATELLRRAAPYVPLVTGGLATSHFLA